MVVLPIEKAPVPLQSWNDYVNYLEGIVCKFGNVVQTTYCDIDRFCEISTSGISIGFVVSDR